MDPSDFTTRFNWDTGRRPFDPSRSAGDARSLLKTLLWILGILMGVGVIGAGIFALACGCALAG